MNYKPITLLAAGLLVGVCDLHAATVLVEAESFSTWTNPTFKNADERYGIEMTGGHWVMDPQTVDQVGSSFLMAHGIGVPVEDATLKIAIPEAGSYRVLVRTRDWHKGIGTFQVLVDGKALPEMFGNKGEGKWLWQDGGKIALTAGEHALALRDLTGLDGRCDCIVLTTDGTLVPPDGGAREQQSWRQKIRNLAEPEVERYDLVVVGGGSGGLPAVSAAAKLGLKVALVSNYHSIGSPSGPPGGLMDGGLMDKAADALRIHPALALLSGSAVSDLQPSKNKVALPVTLLCDWHLYDVAMEGKRIVRGRAVHMRSGEQKVLAALLWVDATGDGNLSVLAGAKWMYGSDSKKDFGEFAAPDERIPHVMGSNFALGGVFPAAEEKLPVSRRGKTFPDLSGVDPYPGDFWVRAGENPFTGQFWGESGYWNKRPDEDEVVRDRKMLWCYLSLSYRAKHPDQFERKKGWGLQILSWFIRKRESRRIVGEEILREQDFWIVKGSGEGHGYGNLARHGGTPHPEARQFPDGCVTTYQFIDLHAGSGSGQADGLPRDWWIPGSVAAPSQRAEKMDVAPQIPSPNRKDRPADIGTPNIPYRCLIVKGVDNLFVSGRCISVTRLALSSTRVRNTNGQIGAAIGRAAAVCLKNRCTPLQSYEKHLDELKAAWLLPAEATSLTP